MNEKIRLRNKCVQRIAEFAERMDGRFELTPEEDEERRAIMQLLEQYHHLPDYDPQREMLRVSYLEARKKFDEMSTLEQAAYGLEELREAESKYLRSMYDDFNNGGGVGCATNVQ